MANNGLKLIEYPNMAANLIPMVKFARYSKCLTLVFVGSKMSQLFQKAAGDYTCYDNGGLTCQKLIGTLTIHSAYRLVDYSLVHDSGCSDLFIYCCTTDGKLFKVDHQAVEQKISSKVNFSGGDVFSELLEEDGIELSLSTKPVYQLQTCDLVYDFNSVVMSLSVACDLVAITSKSEPGFKVHIYGEKDLYNQGKDPLKPLRILKVNCEDVFVGNSSSDKIISKIFTWDKMITAQTKNSDCLMLPVELYKAIVGQEICLMESPVIVIAPPCGMVYCAPIRVTEASSSRIYSDFRLLCETKKPVILLDTMTLKIDNKANSLCEMLTVCSQDGLVNLLGITADESSDLAGVLQTWTISLDGPVWCACCFKNKIYHSTGRYICETTITMTVTSVREGKMVPVTEVRKFQLVGVVDISAYIPGGLIDTDDTPYLLHCFDANGDSTTFNTADHNRDFKLFGSGGRFADTLKETLRGIENVDRQKEEINKQLTYYESILKQISIAASIFKHYLLLPRHFVFPVDSNGSVPFMCTLQARFPEGENSKSIMIDCKITNQMPCNLPCDWGVMVTIEPANSTEDCVSKSFKLNSDFVKGQSLLIAIPIDAKLILLGMEATVFFFLELSFKEHRDFRLCIPVQSQHIDMLYFLHSETTKQRDLTMECFQPSTICKDILKIAKNRPSYSILAGSTTEKDQSSICVNVSICLKSDNMTSSCLNICDPCAILNFLLQNSVSIQPSASSGCYLTFLGQPVYLNVTVKQSGEGGRESTLVTVTIRSDLATAAAVHRSVTKRLQTLLNQTTVTKLQTETLKRKVYDLQDLEDDLSRLQSERQCQDLNQLATVYERLRRITSLE